MKKSPHVSVVMPVYNCSRFLNDAIDSILNQSYPDYELLIINDGSTDKSPAILDQYAKQDSRISVINQQNKGIVSALNHGLSRAKGDWIFRMDGDDMSLPHRFEVQLAAISKDPSLVLLGGWCQQIDTEGRPIKVNRYPATHERLVDALEYVKPFPPHPTACFPRELVLKAGGYNERFLHAEDYDLWLRLSAQGRIGCCQEVVLQLRRHRDNVSNLNGGYDQQLKGIAAAVCYFRRKEGLFDPSVESDGIWNDFIAWLEERLRILGYFDREREWMELKQQAMSSGPRNPLKIGATIVKSMATNVFIRKALYNRLRPERVGLELAVQSRHAVRK